jgi:hypothetical protein
MPFAFVDDSGSGGDSPYFVLAGYSASKSTWFAFWHDWQSVLDGPPKLVYFKMNEAEALKAQFAGFTAEQRTKRVYQFIDVILAHDLFEASIAVPEKHYREILDPLFPGKFANPYYMAFIGLVSAFAARNRYNGSAEETDFIFDEQKGLQDRAVKMYHRLKDRSPHRQLGRVAYRSDRDMLPLQAADLIAWQIRRFKCSFEPKREELLRLHSDESRVFRSTVTQKNFRRLASTLTENLPALRKQFGEDRVEEFLKGLEKRRLMQRTVAHADAVDDYNSPLTRVKA